jgi:hypothetical protein
MAENLPHTNKPGECYFDHINSIAETCDNEYYMSASGHPFSNYLKTL